MNRTLVAIIAAIVVAGAAGAYFLMGGNKNASLDPSDPNGPMAGYIGNTLLSMNQPHYVVRAWYYPDGKFKQFKFSREPGTLTIVGWEGTYTVQGTPGAYQVCMTYNKTPVPQDLPEPSPGCNPIEPHKIGDVWKKSFDDGPLKGTTETFTIREGRNTESG